MKCIVICYSVHEKMVASHDVFNNEEDALLFLEKYALNTYEEEINNCNEKEKEQIDFTLDNGTAYLSSYNGEYEWTWEIIEVEGGVS